uniref:Tryptophan--tRNA ligase, cytoplasmic n=1 Tax=Chromera velia CCMP2878 TaxID=1169474 RepID=A0A0G4HNM3_9ALVE|eukprot:Cvel_7641.t1-p1 / transcript=Cvel_7641.t1 / gene=Cvel_7641 / organism=Chromera_velia_CCMP2878 / gene_product=Tryptophan--tRNA ligase, cytoplasmic, putative / transcript_product=Tryptophan--tRNA ligase, cytoplasmic, putative / location=Cvel_scaffold404:17394-19537(+) / protein_length=469 / sequence_SO=supercontig / SO=protein_coding / is_pseudo=false
MSAPEQKANVRETAAAPAEKPKEKEQVVDAWTVDAGEGNQIDYDKLIRDFGVSRITPTLVERVEAITQRPAHHYLRRGLFFSHRDLDIILAAREKGRAFFLYTGRGPASEALHLGHLIPFQFTKYLQDAFGVPLVIQLTDDEKFLFKDNLKLEEVHKHAYSNAKDIIACGFDPTKTFIFSDLDYIHKLYPVALKIQKKLTYSQSRGIFGFVESDNVGKSAFPAIQAAPAFSESFPSMFGGRKDVLCLIPAAIDQDPYFRMTRDVAQKLGYKKPCNIYSSFFPALQGQHTKMSGSVESSSIFVTDTPKQIKTKINKYAFSGGQDTAEKQRELGADLDVDITYQYLRFVLEDDAELERLGEEYRTGKLLTGEIKAILIGILQEMVKGHQERKSQVTDEVLQRFMDPDRQELKDAFQSLLKPELEGKGGNEKEKEKEGGGKSKGKKEKGGKGAPAAEGEGAAAAAALEENGR